MDPDGLEAASRIFWESWPHASVAMDARREHLWRKVPEILKRQVRVCVMLAIREYLDVIKNKGDNG